MVADLDRKKYEFWSNKIQGERDLCANKSFWWMLSNKFIILIPEGNPETSFSPGFKIGNITKISTATRKVKDGPFAMRMGPKDCLFLAVSKKGKVKLKHGGYITKDDLRKSGLSLY